MQDSSQLVGTQIYVATTKIKNGSTDLFSVITTEQAMLPVPIPDTIGVTVNGIPSACSTPSSCTFTYSSVNQSFVTGVSPSSIVFGNESTVDLIISGSFFNASIDNTEVTLGGVPCIVTSVTIPEIACSLENNITVGIQQVFVNISPFGLAATSAPLASSKHHGRRSLLSLSPLTVLVKALSIMSVAPTVLYTKGWTSINITAKGVDYTNCGNNVATVGGIQCAVMSCGPGTLAVIFPGSTAAIRSASVVVSVLDPATGIVLDSNTWSDSVEISDDSTAAPSIVALVSSPSSGVGGLLSVDLGAAIDPTTVTRVALVPAADISAGFVAFSQAFTTQ